jgi:hypothetical protein
MHNMSSVSIEIPDVVFSLAILNEIFFLEACFITCSAYQVGWTEPGWADEQVVL